MLNIFFKEQNEREECFERLKELANLNSTTSMDNNIEIMLSSVSKGNALEILCGTLKIDEKDARGNVKTRIQVYEGLVMAIKGSKISKTFTVRKMSGNIGTEKTFPINSPRIDSIEVVRKGKVRRAKLNYIRASVKTPKIKERA